MTAQVPDYVEYGRRNFDLLRASGSGLYKPDVAHSELKMLTTACWRGYICYYSVTNRRLRLNQVKIRVGRLPGFPEARRVGDENLFDLEGTEIVYTGGILVGIGWRNKGARRIGFPQPWEKEEVIELEFDEGRFVEATDRTSLFRDNIRLWASPRSDEAAKSLATLVDVESKLSFSYYADWIEDRRRQPDTVSATCPYCSSLLRSNNAVQCFECGWDWHDPDNPVRRGA